MPAQVTRHAARKFLSGLHVCRHAAKCEQFVNKRQDFNRGLT